MSEAERLRVDVWLWRARFAKTRAAAARMAGEGGVRLLRAGASRTLDKPSATVGVGDGLVFPHQGRLMALRIEGLGVRRGPAAEARGLYRELEAEPNSDIGGLA